MNGLEATRQIRRMFAQEKQPYIIAVTANATVQDRNECLAAGMNDHIPKPFRVDELVGALKRSVRSHDEESTRQKESLAAPKSTTRPAIDLALLDELRCLFQANAPGEFNELISEYCATSATLLQDCEKALEQGRLQDARGAAHQLTSSSKGLGAMVFSDLCQQFEHAVRAEKNDVLPRLMRGMKAEFVHVKNELEGAKAPSNPPR